MTFTILLCSIWAGQIRPHTEKEEDKMVTKKLVALFVGMFFMFFGLSQASASLLDDIGTATVRIKGDVCEVVSYAALHKTTGTEYSITATAGEISCGEVISGAIIENGTLVEIVDSVSYATEWKRCFRHYRVAQFFNVYSMEIWCSD